MAREFVEREFDFEKVITRGVSGFSPVHRHRN